MCLNIDRGYLTRPATGLNLILHLPACIQIAKPRALKLFDVNEHVFRAVIWWNEAKLVAAERDTATGLLM